MTYLELINYYNDILKKRHMSKNIILNVIYSCDSRINNLLELTNLLNEKIDDRLLNKITKILNAYIYDNVPLAYLLKEKNFFGIKYKIHNNVLIPRNETEELVSYVIEIIKSRINNFKKWNKKIELLDLCCGSGVIGLSIKNEIKDIDLTLSDISTFAIENSIENAKMLNIEAKFIKSDLFNAINQKFDVIVFNPPYISPDFKLDESILKYEPHNALFAKNNGLYYYEEILSKIKNYLNPVYLVAMEIGYDQAQQVKELVIKHLGVIPKILKDSLGKDRIIIVNRL